MRYTLAEREDLARRKEQWLLRTARGEDPDRVRRELKLKLKVRTLGLLRPRYQQGGRTWSALLDRRHGVATKGTPAVQAFVAKAKAKHPHLPAAELVVQIWERFEIEISVSRLNESLNVAGLSNPVGHPKGLAPERAGQLPEHASDHAGAFFPPGSVERTGRARGGLHRD